MKMKNLSPTTIKKIKEFNNKGLSIQEIAYRTGIDINIVDSVLDINKECLESFIDFEGNLFLNYIK